MIASWICSESTKSGEMALRWVKIMSIAAFTFFAASVSADDLNNGFVKLSEGKPEEAIKLWTPLAESGDKVAQASLGLLYQTGQGVPKDQVRAVELFKRSAKQGYPFAFTALANSYYEGLGVEKAQKKLFTGSFYRLNLTPTLHSWFRQSLKKYRRRFLMKPCHRRLRVRLAGILNVDCRPFCLSVL
jgi:TPR repeat protein